MAQFYSQLAHGLKEPTDPGMINGASGGVGTFAVQIAKHYGAHVTGVCSTRNLEMVLSIGADAVIDYTQENFTEGEQRYDLILDMVGNHSLSDLAASNQADLTFLGELMAAGVTPVIDRRYALSEVPDAIRYVEKGHARGKVVITVPPGRLRGGYVNPCQI